SGLGTTDHDVPSHCSTRVLVRPPKARRPPTANACVASGAAAPLSSSSVCPGFGLGTTAHDEPSHRSIRVRLTSFAANLTPTAHAMDGVTAATPSSSSWCGPGLSLGAMCHAPSHVSVDD